MISRRAAGLFFGLPLAFFLSIGTAAAQDSGDHGREEPLRPKPGRTRRRA